jgi:hypothetical protein
MTDDPRKRLQAMIDKLSELKAIHPSEAVGRCRRADQEKRTQLGAWKVDHARGIIGLADLAAVEGEAADAEVALNEAVEYQQTIEQAIQAEEKAIPRFIMDNWDVFASDAMKASRKAEEYLERANRARQVILAHHQAAVSAWAPLVAAARGYLPRGVPALTLPTVPAGPLRPEGVNENGEITTQKFVPKTEMTEEKLEAMREETRENERKSFPNRQPLSAPVGPIDQFDADDKRAMSPEEVASLKKDTEAERLANAVAVANQ